MQKMISLSPQVRLASLLAFAAVLPWQPPGGLLLAASGVAILLLLHLDIAAAVLGGVRRIRWLLLSLAILYLVFTPGEPLLPALGALSPSRQGLELLLERGAVLLLMLLAALLVLRLTPRAELAAALERGLAPLGRIGLLPERLPSRFGMLFEALGDVEGFLRSARQADGSLARRAARAWMDIESYALDATDTAAVADDPLQLPAAPRWQWNVPLSILAVGSGFIMGG